MTSVLVLQNRSPENESGLLYDKRARCHWRLKNFEEAAADLKKSLELTPSNITTLFLCEIMIEMGKYNEGKEGDRTSYQKFHILKKNSIISFTI